MIPALLLVMGAAAFPARAQGVGEGPLTAQNAVYAEAFGNGLFYSLNYDRMINDRLSGRVGIMYAGAFAAPAMANFLIARRRHHLEVGLGLVFLSSTDVADDLQIADKHLASVMASCTVGYRFQDPAGGLVFRAGFTPLFSFAFDATGLPWFGASVGYSW